MSGVQVTVNPGRVRAVLHALATLKETTIRGKPWPAHKTQMPLTRPLRVQQGWSPRRGLASPPKGWFAMTFPRTPPPKPNLEPKAMLEEMPQTLIT